MKEKIASLLSSIILFLAGTALLFLTAVSACSTSLFVKDELTYRVSDSLLLHLVSVLLFAAVLFCFSRSRPGSRLAERIESDRTFFRRVRIGLTLVLFFLCCLYVLCTQYLPTWDQASALKAAEDLANGNFVDFIPGGYIYCYTSQCGLVFAEYLLSFIFGAGNIVVYQLINAACMALLFYFLSGITEVCGLGRGCALGVQVLSILFLPDILYVSYIYGSVPGLMLSVLSVYELELLFRDGKLRHMLCSSAAIALSVMLKQNYAVFLIGLIITAGLNLLRSGRKLCAVFIAASIVFTGFLSAVPRLAISGITGTALDEGCSPFAWIAMGLQESDGYDPGAYNEYNKYLYSEYGYSSEASRDAAVNNIKKSALQFISGERNPLAFFLAKLSAEWNNPTFSAWFETSLQSDSQTAVPGWMKAFGSVQGEYAASQYLNILEFLILFGAASFLALSAKNARSEFPYPEGALIFLGGFIFFTFWEAKARYTVPFFILLFPYACGGFSILLSLTGRKEAGALRIRKSFLFSLAAAAIVAAVLCLTGSWALLSQSDEAFKTQYEQAANVASTVPENGNYVLVSAEDDALFLTFPDSGENYTACMKRTSEQPALSLSVRTGSGKTVLYDSEAMRFLTSSGKKKVSFGRGNWTGRESWTLTVQKDGTCTLLDLNGKALTRNPEDGSVSVAAAQDDPCQRWRLLPVGN